MNPENPTPREELEARLTALLLGELPEAEAEALRAAISQDPALAALQARLEPTIAIVRETAATPATEAAEQSAPLQLSAERREKLFAHFKAVAPREFAAPRGRRRQSNKWVALCLLAAAAVVLLVGGVESLVAELLMPALAKSKAKSQRGGNAFAFAIRAPGAAATEINLKQIDRSKQKLALANKKLSDAAPNFNWWTSDPSKLNGAPPDGAYGEQNAINASNWGGFDGTTDAPKIQPMQARLADLTDRLGNPNPPATPPANSTVIVLPPTGDSAESGAPTIASAAGADTRQAFATRDSVWWPIRAQMYIANSPAMTQIKPWRR